MNPERLLFSDPDRRRQIFSKKYRYGLTDGSIVQTDLYFPNKETNSLNYEQTLLGRWCAYDFQIKSIVGRKAVDFKKDRKLLAFPLEAIIENSPDSYTPLGLCDPYSLDFLEAVFPSMTELISLGLAKETTYGAAFEYVGKFRQYHDALRSELIIDKPVYQVTPKGNGLIYAIKEIGDTSQRKKEMPALSPALVPLRF